MEVIDTTKLRELLRATSPGKWTVECDNADHSGGGCWYELQIDGKNPFWYPYNARPGVAEQAEANATYVAAVLEAAPALLAKSDRADALEADNAKLRDDLAFVERWANHHGAKPGVTPREALSVIQHYPPITDIQAEIDRRATTDGREHE